MPFQKTFSLASRGKGCHLVTDEVMKNIQEGLKGTKVSSSRFIAQRFPFILKAFVADPFVSSPPRRLALRAPPARSSHRSVCSPSSFSTLPPALLSTRTLTGM